MSYINSAIILAAGNGSRLQSSTPKVLQKVGGLTLLDHLITNVKKANIEDIVVVSKSGFDKNELKCGMDVSLAFQENPNGTGDAVKCGLQKISAKNDGWVYVLYGDIPFVSSEILEELLHVANVDDKTGIVVLAMDNANNDGLGKLEAAVEGSGTIKAIVEAKDAAAIPADSKLSLCNAGLLIKKTVLAELIDQIKPSDVTGEVYVTEIVRLAYLYGVKCRYLRGENDELSGVNTCAELAVMESIFQKNMRKKHLENGVRLIAPETVFFHHDTEIENDVTIHPYVVFLEGVQIKSGSVVGPFCVIEGSDVRNAQVGPFARLRYGSEIHENAKIGNFVEIKNSVISEKSKVNHLSYVGDCSVGKNTNIGAGTITCNYDGFQKHRTVVGENVFVGSNSAIVAPVNIGDNAMVGAGSVITKDINDEDLAVSRSKQINYEKAATYFRKSAQKRKQARRSRS